MRWISWSRVNGRWISGSRMGRSRIRGRLPLRVSSLILLTAFLLHGASSEKRLAVYSTAANYSLPVVQRDGRDYVGLLELLDPLGAVNAKAVGPRWRLRYNNVFGEFTAGQSHARIQGRDFDLSARFELDNGRGLVPVASLASLLPRILGGPVTLHEDSARLFIGNIATHFTASVAGDDPSHLVFRFTSPVNPTIAAEPGKLRMTFTREPLTAPASPTLTFGSTSFPSATYSENNGAAEITVSTTLPLMASFSNNGRTITLGPASVQQTAATATRGSIAAQPTANSAAPQTSTVIPPQAAAASASAPAIARRYFAVIDASHGGDDRGETLSTTLAEKDVTVAFARRLRQELENRGISTLVLRDSDANVSLDDRAFYANSFHAAVYVALHAASSGHGVRVYTALIPYGSDDRGPFRSWTTAQSSYLPVSETAAASVATELKKQNVPVRALSAPLRPLNSVVTAAIAVEVAPQASDVAQLMSPDYQQLVVSAVANGIAAVRDKLGATP